MGEKIDVCCTPAPPKAPCCCSPKGSEIRPVTSELTSSDRWGAFACRISNKFRMDYTVDPGLYALGTPSDDSPIFISANYRLSFNHLRSALAGRNAWIVVLDTKGINVWCAAGKGTFGTAEIIKRIGSTGISEKVKHRAIILPQLGAPGVSAHEVKKATGFTVKYGPVRTADLPEYLDHGHEATPAMRTATFTTGERFILTPMEMIPALRKFLWVIVVCLAVMGLQPSGLLFKPALAHSWPILVAGLVSLLCGTLLTPVLLPVIPFRSFALKGALASAVLLAPLFLLTERLFLGSTFLTASAFVFFIASASYLALNFTGCTTFTNISGVKKEMRIAVPAYLVASGISAILLLLFKLQEWRVL